MKFLISLFLVFSLYGKVIDKIEIIVNNIPITSYDILKTSKELNLPKDKAIAYLIDQAVMESIIKEKKIYVDEFDIDNEMEKIAQKNGMSLFNFKNYLLQQGKLEELKTQIKRNLERKKLLKTLNIVVTQDEMKNYYELHKNEFLIASTIETKEYTSQDRNKLLQFINNPLLQVSGITQKDVIFNAKTANPRLLSFLAKTKEGSFTPIVKIQNRWVVFYVVKKKDVKPLDYNMVQGYIYNKLLTQKQNQALQDFILKLRQKADIEFLK